MKTLWTIGLVLWSSIVVCSGQTLVLKQAVLAPSNEVLVNPNMGLYLTGTLNEKDVPPGAWFDKAIGIGYFRDDWSKIQPNGPGPSHFDAYFKPIFDLWVTKWHKRVAFRFMSQNMHSDSAHATPQWVFDAGVPSEKFKGVYVKKQIDPVFWDDKYLKIQEQTIADLGKYLDGRPGLEFIDIGSIGEWGEMHLMRWTPQQLADSGYTPEKYIEAYRRIIDAFARAFPHTHVFLNVGDWATINDYAAIHGINFRQDGLTPSGPSADVGNRFYREYARRGILCNYELYGGYDEMKQKGWGIAATFNKGLEDPISYFHMNLFGFDRMLTATQEVRTAVLDAARRVGYRFAPNEVDYTPVTSITPGRAGRIMIKSEWKNSGVAPCTDSYALDWSILDNSGNVIANKLSFPTVPTTHWWPGDTISQSDSLTIPPTAGLGHYHLAVSMVKPEEPALSIQLALLKGDTHERYSLGDIDVIKGLPHASVTYVSVFPNDISAWQKPDGLSLASDTAPLVQGTPDINGALRLFGTPTVDTWNYASTAVPKGLLPGSRYKLTGWMKIAKITPGAAAPYFKLGVNTAEGKWITNSPTGVYDLDQIGKWQQLTGWIETDATASEGEIAVEKGNLESRPTVDMEIAGVRLDLLESPGIQ